jgi:hypothetical protein
LEGNYVSDGCSDFGPVDLTERILAIFKICAYFEYEYMDDGIVREEYAEDAPFVGRRRDRPPPSFRVGPDVYAGYFLAVRSTDGDLRPFWVARAISNPNPDPGHHDQIQYWRPNSF